MREEALSTKIEQLLDEKTCLLTGQKNIWDLGYKSTSDEEDNDSDDNIDDDDNGDADDDDDDDGGEQ